MLLTLGDTEERRRYLNARGTIGTLLKLRAVPVINENDTVATSEIRYGDNDRLAARVATMMSADLLVLLSDVAGLYTAAPATDPAAHADRGRRAHHPRRSRRWPAPPALSFRGGGMQTKIEAGKIATAAGTAMVIASGHEPNPLAASPPARNAPGSCPMPIPSPPASAGSRGTWKPAAPSSSMPAPSGALRAGKSLLPAGVRRVEGSFHRGDAVDIRGLGRRGDRPRPRRLRRRRCRAHRRAQQRRDRDHPWLRRPRRDDPTRRHGAPRGVSG
ncbi:MAG: PUA domain-containing protein [Bauldia sp.]